MPLLCSIQLVDVILPTFSDELLVLGTLVCTWVVPLLCISYYPLKVSLCFAHYFGVECKTNHLAVIDKAIY